MLYAGNTSGDGCNVTVSGGNVLAYGPQLSEDTWFVQGGNSTFLDYNGFIDIYADGPGTIAWNSAGGIENLRLSNGAVFNAENDDRAFTIYGVDLYAGSSFLDGLGRSTITTGIDFNLCAPQDVTLRLGRNFKLNQAAVT